MLTDELRELLAKATPLPWSLNPPSFYHGGGATYDVPEIDMHDATYYNSAPSKADAALMVAAVNALPALLAQSKADAARIAELEEALEPFAEATDNLDDEPDDAEMWEHSAVYVLTAGHLRKAAAALAKAGAA